MILNSSQLKFCIQYPVQNWLFLKLDFHIYAIYFSDQEEEIVDLETIWLKGKAWPWLLRLFTKRLTLLNHQAFLFLLYDSFYDKISNKSIVQGRTPLCDLLHFVFSLENCCFHIKQRWQQFACLRQFLGGWDS